MFTPTELQFLYDATVNFSIRPEFRDNVVVEMLSESIAVKIEEELMKAGFRYVETEATVSAGR